ncbi:MAG TPA: hypothetical protein PKL73_21910, partial [Polyangiaceae bacterium]|nr:hypothetical protein [Polyangiaceae bacterium]
WFGPTMSLTFEVVDCAGGAAGAGGSGGAAGMGGTAGESGADAAAGASAGGGQPTPVPAATWYETEEPEGCACGIVGTRKMSALWLVLLGGWLGWRRRREVRLST